MKEKKEKRPKNKKVILIVLLTVAAVLTVTAVIFGVHLYRIIKNPASLFENPDNTEQVGDSTAMPPAFTFETDETAEPDTETDDITEPDTENLPSEEKPYDVLNIMLMGIDAYEDGSTSSGTMPHTDVSIVLAVNFENQTIDMISLQRDTFTTIPGYRGYYKLNGVFNVGGGMNDKNGGFELVCRTAEQWLGGISIPYYYAVDFKAVVDIVDAMGGIDYDVDQPFTAHGSAKQYGYGRHHLDGSAVLGYLRIRKQADGLDKSRNTRQRKMLFAIFEKLKSEGKFSAVPALLSAAGNHVYTNTTMSQTAAFANFASNIDPDNIRLRAVAGTIKMEYDWAWAFVDQAERVQLIKEVYNINVKPVGICTLQYENWLHETGFDALKHIRQAEKVLEYVQQLKDGGYEFSDEQIKQYARCYTSYNSLHKLFSDATLKLGNLYTDPTAAAEDVKAAEEEYAELIKSTEDDVRTYAGALKDSVGYKGDLSYTIYKYGWFADKDINEIYVDFR